MTAPIPDPANIPGVPELEARHDHARHLRETQPGITNWDILNAWNALDRRDRWQRITDAQVRLLERAAR